MTLFEQWAPLITVIVGIVSVIRKLFPSIDGAGAILVSVVVGMMVAVYVQYLVNTPLGLILGVGAALGFGASGGLDIITRPFEKHKLPPSG